MIGGTEATRGSVGSVLVEREVDLEDAIAVTAYVESRVSAHPHFAVRANSGRLAQITGGWRITVHALRLGTSGMKRRYRAIYGVGPTPDLAASNLIEGLDHYSEMFK